MGVTVTKGESVKSPGQFWIRAKRSECASQYVSFDGKKGTTRVDVTREPIFSFMNEDYSCGAAATVNPF